MGEERTWLVAIVAPIRGTDPTSAWEEASRRFFAPSDGLGDDVLFATSPLVCEPRDLMDPDFDVTVLSHGRELEHAPEPEEEH